MRKTIIHIDCSLEVIKQNLKNRKQIGLGIETNILVHLSEAWEDFSWLVGVGLDF